MSSQIKVTKQKVSKIADEIKINECKNKNKERFQSNTSCNNRKKISIIQLKQKINSTIKKVMEKLLNKSITALIIVNLSSSPRKRKINQLRPLLTRWDL